MPEPNRKYRSLVKNCIRAQAKAQKELYNLFASKMLSVCFRYARNKVDAEDIFQSGWLKTFENLHQLRNSGLLEWWMKKIFVNEALQFYNKTKLISFTDNDSIYDREIRGDHKIYDAFQYDEITRLIQNLPDKKRMVFNLYIIEGFSHKEIAKMMNISEGTSKSQLHDARKIVQEQIKMLDGPNTVKQGSL